MIKLKMFKKKVKKLQLKQMNYKNIKVFIKFISRL